MNALTAIIGAFKALVVVVWPYLERTVYFLAGAKYAQMAEEIKKQKAENEKVSVRLKVNREVGDLRDGSAADILRKLTGIR